MIVFSSLNHARFFNMNSSELRRVMNLFPSISRRLPVALCQEATVFDETRFLVSLHSVQLFKICKLFCGVKAIRPNFKLFFLCAQNEVNAQISVKIQAGIKVLYFGVCCALSVTYFGL